ncbi:MAG: periplasmic heavy metal sensor [Algoriphagus sp.]|jgi:TonB-dependent SusC/RagA subfamily outer membrane receptor|uniref:Spy/CpxP family protein refolding chaperone n=1 Tax=Algoriphagus sp. TaxID=1872435 RepID=UPI002619FBAB|nr:periplasmic heavy metal sensor [Algoriphagus sp.]MDG1276442.1 periplasmic heavy metal sensor [Algoriphagus sp.]
MKHLLLIALLLCSTLTFAQDIYQKNLYSADRIMENREKLGLTDAQAAKIKKIHTDNASDFSTLKWDLDAATARLKSMLEESKIDPVLVNKQMDEVLRLEGQLKKKQLNTLVAIKNELTSPQQKMLEYERVKGLAGTGTFFAKPTPSPLGTSNIRIGQPAYGFEPKVTIEAENGNPDTTPLYIIKTKDGEVEKTDLKDINPNDIESISVIKGPTATFEYGDKGKNGVIIITLKKNSKYYLQKK